MVENVQPNIDIVGDKRVMQSVISQIDEVYKQIKKNEEIIPGSSSYSKDEHRKNESNSIIRLNMMSRAGF